MSNPKFEHMFAAQKASSEVLVALMRTSFEGMQRLAELNMAAAKQVLSTTAANANTLASAKDLSEVSRLGPQMAKPEQLMDYWRNVYDLVTTMQKDVTEVMQSNYTSLAKNAASAIERSPRGPVDGGAGEVVAVVEVVGEGVEIPRGEVGVGIVDRHRQATDAGGLDPEPGARQPRGLHDHPVDGRRTHRQEVGRCRPLSNAEMPKPPHPGSHQRVRSRIHHAEDAARQRVHERRQHARALITKRTGFIGRLALDVHREPGKEERKRVGGVVSGVGNQRQAVRPRALQEFEDDERTGGRKRPKQRFSAFAPVVVSVQAVSSSLF